VTDAPIPADPSGCTAAWLTERLHEAGHLPLVAHVQSVTTSIVGQGAGFVGTVARLEVIYVGNAAGAPASLIAKLPATDVGSREVGSIFLGLYAREVAFYKEIAADVAVATPRCYFALHDPDTGRSILLLEDLRTGRFGDQVLGCSPADAHLALTEIAALHARWWNSSRLSQFSWMVPGPNVARNFMGPVYDACWPICLKRFEHVLTPRFVREGATLGRKFLAALATRARLVNTLRHADFRLDNLFFGNPGTDRPLVVCDWQAVGPGLAAYDVAYFLVTGMEPAVRRAHQDDLLRAYRDRLAAHGITDYKADAFGTDVRWALAAAAAVFVINGANLPTVNERGVAVLEHILSRLTIALEEFDTYGLLDRRP